jgi:single-strand DNA-binding protein
MIASGCPQVVDNLGTLSTGGGRALLCAAHSGTVEVRTERRMPPGAGRTPKARMEDGDMSQENMIILRGFVTAEPKFWQSSPTQTPLAEIRLGHTPRRLNRTTGEWEDGTTSYYSIKCWRRLAINVKGSLRKGDMILVRGKVVMRTWVDDQQRNRTQMQVEADSVGHDLAFGWSHFNRGDQSPWNATRRQAEDEAAQQDPEMYEDADESDALGAPDDPAVRNGADATYAADDSGDSEMADADLEKLTSDLGAQPDVAPAF